ncbi:hypothetical protein [Streptomyces sp. NBC_01446]|uniref:hypothetical protein n=1 Tax=Streptomyces sp. NBC_01446 TaxID=2903870 RepID=UPI00225B3C9C|nr:hypothetical protein [Streptomyces sp. NBC_01446]MCX4647059.1 hypothetical protein [Streptomyces sp. NBC_01446]
MSAAGLASLPVNGEADGVEVPYSALRPVVTVTGAITVMARAAEAARLEALGLVAGVHRLAGVRPRAMSLSGIVVVADVVVGGRRVVYTSVIRFGVAG